ncbi:MAG: Asp-tRNA(Asn)/Glu-tRNA(Gln) amidotransferase subunit GatB, partial [Alphaproteobacteria bacterium]|nr:Asp-tRNA(Asn)/Glu-tRNA(Gln) amidotransferase subunit GatB [Alphaproteobacteria bacterium]
SEEAGIYVKKLRSILRYIGASDGDMEKGNLRADANVSVRRPGEKLGTRCEIKNVNSVRFLIKAIDYEAARQVQILEEGGTIDQETRLFDSAKGETRTMRSKEEAHDYRYFPDPDLLPLEIAQDWVESLYASLPELPDAKKQRYMREYGLSAYDAGVLVSDKAYAEYYETLAARHDPRLAATWMTVELFGRLNKLGVELENSPIGVTQFSGLLGLIGDGTLSGKLAKDVLDRMVETGEEAGVIVEREGLRQVTDTGAIEKAIDEVMVANRDKVTEYRAGKDKLFGFFIGQVMKATGGKANPAALNDLLKKKLAP